MRGTSVRTCTAETRTKNGRSKPVVIVAVSVALAVGAPVVVAALLNGSGAPGEAWARRRFGY
jgi:hypothetical protein